MTRPLRTETMAATIATRVVRSALSRSYWSRSVGSIAGEREASMNRDWATPEPAQVAKPSRWKSRARL